MMKREVKSNFIIKAKNVCLVNYCNYKSSMDVGRSQKSAVE